MKYCEYCGEPVNQNEKYCTNCGASLIESQFDDIDINNNVENNFEDIAKEEIINHGTDNEGSSDKEKLKNEAYHSENTLWNNIFRKILYGSLIFIAIILIIGLFKSNIPSIVFSFIGLFAAIASLLIHNNTITAKWKALKYQILLVFVIVSALNISSFSWRSNGDNNLRLVPEVSPTPIVTPEPQEVLIPIEYEECINKDLDSLVELFKNAGFKNIESNPAKDLEAKESEKLNTVKSVFINKSKNFKEGDSVKDNCNIVIYYHAYKNIPYPYSAKDIEHTDVNVLIDSLTDAGFVNIETKEVFDLDPDAINYKVKNTVYINGNSNYTKGDEFPLDCPIEITSHYPYDKYTLKLHISFIPNLFFNKYSVEVKKDGKELGVLSHGEDMDYVFREKPGKYTFTFKKYQYKSPENKFTIDLKGNLDVTYRLSCYEDSIHLEQTQYFDESLVGENEIMLMCSESSFRYKDYKIVEDTIRGFGFTNISTEILYDIVYGWTKEGEVDSVSFNGDRSYSKGAIFDKDVPIVITYHLKEQDNPAYIPVTASSDSFVRKNSDEVYKAISEMGFTNINYSTYKYYDTTHSEKEVKSVTINGYSFKEDERFDPNARIVITYYIKGERSSSSNSNSNTTATPKPTYYSTNTIEKSKDGNSGVFAYRNRGGSYYIYYIIDFDQGYVYSFCHGNGDATGERLKITEGDLNKGVVLTYHDGDSTWENYLHFKWSRQPDHLILVDSHLFEYDFYPTDLDEALKLKNTKKMIDY